jgi:hypothetical protein
VSKVGGREKREMRWRWRRKERYSLSQGAEGVYQSKALKWVHSPPPPCIPFGPFYLFIPPMLSPFPRPSLPFPRLRTSLSPPQHIAAALPRRRFLPETPFLPKR